MASEAEIERLYQLFVTNGGGALSFSGTNLTPKQYSEALATSNLTPLEMAQLEARQRQYNKSVALNSIADEIDANNFTNPYAARGAYGSSLLNTLGASTGVTNVGLLSSALSGFSTGDKALIFAGVLAASGVDLEQIIKIAGLSALGLAMYSSLTNHTNNQTANIPETMQNASNLASMNSQFGPAGGPRPPGETDCDSFNDLMGILSGAYDGTLDYIDRIIGDISSFINQSGIGSLLSNIISAIAGAGSIVADVISAIVGVGIQLLGGIIGVVAKVINAIADITSAIANEINNIANMAAELLRKALALVLGGAALDPCKRAVLMNTGSTEMKAAVTQLNQPLGTAAPGGVGTTVDPRANADEVTRNMKHARDEAKLNPGVPQSPFEESASNYTTKDESLHADATQSEIPVLRGNLETTTTSSSYTYIPNTPSPELARKVGESMEEFLRRSGVTPISTTEKDVKAPRLAKSAEMMINDWREKQLNYTRDSRALISSMNDALKKRDFPTKKASLSNRLKVLVSLQTDNQKIITNLTNKYIDSFYYTGGSILLNENRIDLHYLGRIYPAQTRTYNNAVTSLNAIQTEWKSIDIQLH
tara:strand:+ start:4676 stop:6454 length:1779 start_codon:yes stop_codon:yes gene_type:complete